MEKELDLLKSEDVCKILKIKRETLYNWIYLGKIKALKFSKRMVRFRREDIREFVKEK